MPLDTKNIRPAPQPVTPNTPTDTKPSTPQHRATDSVDSFAKSGPSGHAPTSLPSGPMPSAPSEVRATTTRSASTGRIPTLPAEVHRALVELSAPSTVRDLEDFASRIERINDIFVAHKDPRGAFPALYTVITNYGLKSIQEERYEDMDWGTKLVTDFGDLYLENLHAHLTGKPASPGWTRYYNLADNPNVSLERLVSVGATVHLVIDLPESLARIGTPPEREQDFMRFGDILLEGYPDMLASARDGHDIDMSEIFGLFGPGNLVDSMHGEGTSTRFGFQTIRRKAWIFGQWKQDIRSLAARAEIAISWRTIDGILANLDAAKIL